MNKLFTYSLDKFVTNSSNKDYLNELSKLYKNVEFKYNKNTQILIISSDNLVQLNKVELAINIILKLV